MESMALNTELTSSYFLDFPLNSPEEINFHDEVFFLQNQIEQITNIDQRQEIDVPSLIEESQSATSSRSSLANFLGNNYSTTNTTPEFSSPPKLMNARGSSISSLPIDQLNLLSLRSLSTASRLSDSPTPECNFSRMSASPTVEERTINPRQLLTMPNGVSNGNVELSEENGSNTTHYSSCTKNYILPSSSSSPSLSTSFNVNCKTYVKSKSHSVSMSSKAAEAAKVDFVMNNECFNAILYWMNDTLQNVNSKISEDGEELGGAEEIMINPTGIIKPNFSRRRNSIEMMRPSLHMKDATSSVEAFTTAEGPQAQRRKRRKSYNYEHATAKDESTHVLHSAAATLSRSPAATLNNSASAHKLDLVLGSHTPKENNTNNEEEEEKPFPCPDCSKQFKRSEHLKRHIRSVHSNIRPFHCKYCEKKFSRSDNLAQHLKTHYKVNNNGTTSIIYGNPNLHNRGGRKKLSDC